MPATTAPTTARRITTSTSLREPAGVCPTSTGAEHMRSMSPMPAGWKMFPGYLRDAGYYCTNNGKEDYNLHKPPGTWDVSAEAVQAAGRGAGKAGRGAGRGAAAGAIGAPFNPPLGHWRG